MDSTIQHYEQPQERVVSSYATAALPRSQFAQGGGGFVTNIGVTDLPRGAVTHPGVNKHSIQSTRAVSGARTNQRVALRRRVATAGLLVNTKQERVVSSYSTASLPRSQFAQGGGGFVTNICVDIYPGCSYTPRGK